MIINNTSVTTTRHNVIVLSIAAILSAGVFFALKKEKQGHRLVQAKVFRGPSGWGYDILVDDTLFIRQESIPVLSGDSGFRRKEQAIEAAQLIINKMERGQSPTVSKFEIIQITKNGHWFQTELGCK